jgi:hypothetical protein
MAFKSLSWNAIFTFFQRRSTLIGRIALALLASVHSVRAVAFASGAGYEQTAIGAAGVAAGYWLTLLAYWRNDEPGVKALVLVSTGLSCIAQIVFPEAAGYVGAFVFLSQIAIMGYKGMVNILLRP